MHQEKLKNRLVYFLIFFASFNKVEAQLWQQPSAGMELSNLHVQSIVQDSLGYIWMATARGVDRLDGYGQPHFFLNKSDHTSLSNDNVYKLFVSRKGELYVFTRWGLNVYNRLNDSFIRLKDSNGDYLYSCAEQDAGGNIWLGTNDAFKLSYVDSKLNRICSLKIPQINQSVQNICCDDKGYLWIVLNKDRGVIVYNPRTRRVVAKLNNDVRLIFRGPKKNTLYGITSTNKIILINSITGKTIGVSIYSKAMSIEKVDISADRRLYVLTDDMQLHIYDKKAQSFNTRNIEGINSVYNVTSVFLDKQSNIWIGTFEEGYKFIPFRRDNFNIDIALSNYFQNKFVTYLTGNGKDKTWIATRHEGLQEFNRKTGTVKMLLNMRLKNEESAIACCYYDSQKRLWVATVGAIYCYQTTHGTTLIGHYNNITRVRYITEDKQGNIWIVSNGNKGIWMLPKLSKMIKFVNPFTSLCASSSIMYFMQLRSGSYLFSSFGNNVYIGDLYGRFRPFFTKDVDPVFLKSVTYIYEDSKGLLWLGTYGCGLMRYDILHHQKKIFTMQEGLPSNDILAITEDKIGNIWLSTSFGLSRIIGGKVFVNYFTKDGLLGNQYHERSVYAEGGILYFTGNHGITSFRPETIHVTRENVPLIIESLISDERTYVPYTYESSKIKLSYKENSFTVSFLGFDFSSAHNLQYSYMLEGYDQHWSTPSMSRIAKFSNIPSGAYIMKVKVCDKEGMWNNKCIKLKIVIPPAPWATWWAIMIYIILISGFIYWLLRLYINYKIDNEKFKMSEETLQRERDLNQAKINFFENISHELRTPLGLIYGPFCELSKEKGLSDKTKKYMSLMGANIERLMSLVEQILNFSHLNSETMSLAVDKVEVIAFVRKIMKRFEGENEEKHIKMTFSPLVEGLEMLVDQDKMDKILSNLLSNAFKYTPSGGNIFLSLSILSAQEVQKDYNQKDFVASKYVQFSIKDSGIGVPKEELNRIFDRFYRSKSKSNVSVVGSGIGLYYIKCLTLKHKGFIKAVLNADKGMTFMFCLPLDVIYSTCERQKRPSNLWVGNREIDKIIIADSIQSDDERNEDNKGIKEKPQLLIVEDEPNLQDFLYNLLQHYYCIEKAYDGSEGLKKALESIPDIILADVMMPVMNGYELCEKIKSDLHTCHIPVILLTAKSNIDEQIEGMSAGADVYISKPFNPDYLISVLQGTILNRRRMQHIIIDVCSATPKISEFQNHLTKMDEELLQKLNNQIEAELGNPELSIDVLSSKLNFSRSTFYRKIKSLTGLSPNDYIRVYKVKRAAQLIESGDYFLSEIGDMTGFSTQSYFSAIFKKHYGMTPTEYKNLKFNKE